MQWLSAALIVIFSMKVRNSRPTVHGGYTGAPDVKSVPGAAIFWTHQTTAGFSCAGYCDNVVLDGDNVLFNNMICIDLTQTGGVDTPKFLSVPKSKLKNVSGAAMGCVVLPMLITAGMLDGDAGKMLFDNPATGKQTWITLGRHSLTLTRETPNLYQVTDDTDWGIFWAGAAPFPVNVEITPAGIGA